MYLQYTLQVLLEPEKKPAKELRHSASPSVYMRLKPQYHLKQKRSILLHLLFKRKGSIYFLSQQRGQK